MKLLIIKGCFKHAGRSLQCQNKVVDILTSHNKVVSSRIDGHQCHHLVCMGNHVYIYVIAVVSRYYFTRLP